MTVGRDFDSPLRRRWRQTGRAHDGGCDHPGPALVPPATPSRTRTAGVTGYLIIESMMPSRRGDGDSD